jgi:hypothetical protein
VAIALSSAKKGKCPRWKCKPKGGRRGKY